MTFLENYLIDDFLWSRIKITIFQTYLYNLLKLFIPEITRKKLRLN